MNTATDHALYISVLEIDGKQMKVKVFTDNLQYAIQNDIQSPVQSDEETFLIDHRSAIDNYFQKTIRIQLHGRPIHFNLVEMTMEKDSYWIIYKLDKMERYRRFNLEANYFMELFPDQTNVIKVIGKVSTFFRLTKGDRSCEFKF